MQGKAAAARKEANSLKTDDSVPHGDLGSSNDLDSSSSSITTTATIAADEAPGSDGAATADKDADAAPAGGSDLLAEAKEMQGKAAAARKEANSLKTDDSVPHGDLGSSDDLDSSSSSI